MRKKILFASLLLVAGAAVVAPTAANAPPHGYEQYEEWFGDDGALVGYVHWTCDGQRVTWGSRNGELVVTRVPCPSL